MIMPAIRTIIADDEHLARKKLRLLLSSEPGVQVVAECEEQLEIVRPEFVFVGISFPKQQAIALALIDACEARGERPPIMLTLGASFEMYLGLCARAPRMMQRLGLEWFFRFLREPRRLFKRYFVADLRFAWLVLRELVSARD